MSKTTQRYGKPLYSMSTVIDGSPTAPKAITQQWAKLDAAARKDFNKPYDALDGKEKAQLHFKLNELRQKNRERQSNRQGAKEMEIDARIDRELAEAS